MSSFRYIPVIRKLSNTIAISRINIKDVPHIPVMAEKVLEYMQPDKEQVILDMTFGSGGHSRKILDQEPNVKIIALDRDPLAYSYACKLLEEYPGRIIPLLGKFSDLPVLLKEKNFRKNSLDGILFDFGCSSMQFDLAHRGFSISKNGPLDMRMDGDRDPSIPTAADVLSRATEEHLYKIIKYYGQESQARKIARAVVDSRYLFKKLTTTEELADLVETVITENFDGEKLHKKSHVATKTFQALRIFVNNELNEINYGLILADYYLKLGGRLVTITFHSLEDTIVKRHLMGNLIENSANPLPLKLSNYNFNLGRDAVHNIMQMKWNMLHKSVLVPSIEEIETNNRSRSAKLRAAIKIR
ncbi:probable methyltransferase-like protein 15 homolog [Sitophilus oryzae]|uniref:Probable methyltransferase-like protein 15 homolog n=1 Tax=Sitophilus oryzae TaxID=7048 RepID=A0A6J2YMM5_SITOR|nr:probable methyltransferase-like protein 15 homolog [Sitophilus oryzae]